MIFYKPLINIEEIKKEFVNFDLNNNTYGAYIGYDENEETVGKCLMSVNGYKCNIIAIDCDYSDKLLVEGFVRAALNFCANRNAYMAYCDLVEITEVLEYLGFEKNNDIYSGDIPTLLKGSCCK